MSRSNYPNLSPEGKKQWLRAMNNEVDWRRREVEKLVRQSKVLSWIAIALVVVYFAFIVWMAVMP